jgi:hypothetical protein
MFSVSLFKVHPSYVASLGWATHALEFGFMHSNYARVKKMSIHLIMPWLWFADMRRDGIRARMWRDPPRSQTSECHLSGMLRSSPLKLEAFSMLKLDRRIGALTK